jgi:hypothetical protein
MARPLAEFVVLVLQGDDEVGRAVALAMAGRGARVVVVGKHERVLGEVVGEVAFAGGQARHAVGGVAEGQAKARATWGRVDFVVAGEAARALRGRSAPQDSPEGVAEAIADALAGSIADEAVASAPREP